MTTESPSPWKRPEKPPVPGDLFVLRATAELPVEWVLLEKGSGGRFLAVPADAGPPAGTADVEVPAGSPGGPLNLRCRFSLWLDASLIDPELRSGTLARESVEDARFRIRQIETGKLEGSPLAEEIDADSEYQDWIRDVPEQAVKLVSTGRPVERSPSRFPWVYLIAATFAALSVGLSFWVVTLRQEVKGLSIIAFDVPSVYLDLSNAERGGKDVPVPPEAKWVELRLTVDVSLDIPVEERVGRFEILNSEEELVFRSPVVDPLGMSEIPLFVPRNKLPNGSYSVRFHPSAGDDDLPEAILTVQTKKEQP